MIKNYTNGDTEGLKSKQELICDRAGACGGGKFGLCMYFFINLLRNITSWQRREAYVRVRWNPFTLLFDVRHLGYASTASIHRFDGCDNEWTWVQCIKYVFSTLEFSYSVIWIANNLLFSSNVLGTFYDKTIHRRGLKTFFPGLYPCRIVSWFNLKVFG